MKYLIRINLSYNLRQRKRIRMVYLQHKSCYRLILLLIAIRSSNIDYNLMHNQTKWVLKWLPNYGKYLWNTSFSCFVLTNALRYSYTSCLYIPIYDWNTSLESIWVITYGSASASAVLMYQYTHRYSLFKHKYKLRLFL